MLEKIKEIAADSLGADVSTLTAATSFKEDLGADSLDLFEMVMALEEEFDVEIPTEDLEGIKTIGDVESYLQHRQYRLCETMITVFITLNGDLYEDRNYRITWNRIPDHPGWYGLGGRISSGSSGF